VEEGASRGALRIDRVRTLLPPGRGTPG
jgi:hypothetical protein